MLQQCQHYIFAAYQLTGIIIIMIMMMMIIRPMSMFDLFWGDMIIKIESNSSISPQHALTLCKRETQSAWQKGYPACLADIKWYATQLSVVDKRIWDIHTMRKKERWPVDMYIYIYEDNDDGDDDDEKRDIHNA